MDMTCGFGSQYYFIILLAVSRIDANSQLFPSIVEEFEPILSQKLVYYLVFMAYWEFLNYLKNYLN